MKRRPDSPFKLTSRELEVLRYIAKGTSKKDIPGMLSVKDGTVKKRVESILEKMGLRPEDKHKMIAEAVNQGILLPSEVING